MRLKNKPMESLWPVNMKDVDQAVDFFILVGAFALVALWAFWA